MTIATPLSTASTMWSLPLLSSLKAIDCALVKLDLGCVKIVGLD